MTDLSIPRACGSDRVRQNGDVLEIESRHPKRGWRERTPGALHAEFPGTAVRWEDDYYEVVDVEELQPSGCRYTLAPWNEANVFRTFEEYDEPTEEKRRRERDASRIREARRKRWMWASLLTGHLPGEVQEEWGSEYGVKQSLPTIISAIPPLIIGTGALIFIFVAALGGAAAAPLPLNWMLPLPYFMIESLFRYGWVMATGRPIGSLLGGVGYLIGRGVKRIARSRSAR